MATCKHEDFVSNVVVNRLEDSGRFNADVRIICKTCGVPMRFIGLPYGVDLNGAAVSVDGTEGRFAIAPKGEVATMIDDGSVGGFTVRRDGVNTYNYGDNPPAWFIVLFLVAALALLAMIGWLIPACNESATYNRLTGAHTTTWDAMWVELRVQDAARKE